jgi:hypothetical protein
LIVCWISAGNLPLKLWWRADTIAERADPVTLKHYGSAAQR